MRFPVFFALVFSAFAQDAVAQDIVLPEGKAKSIVQGACGDCHGLETVVNNPMSSDQWRVTVNKMVKRGAALTPEQIDQVVDYLSVYFAPDKTNVNTATSQELQAALLLTASEADAIVQYRKANGNFKDMAALSKVSGVDPKKLEAKKDEIAF
jgi:competence ComEA-like helix-hairpin-helix protein